MRMCKLLIAMLFVACTSYAAIMPRATQTNKDDVLQVVNCDVVAADLAVADYYTVDPPTAICQRGMPELRGIDTVAPRNEKPSIVTTGKPFRLCGYHRNTKKTTFILASDPDPHLVRYQPLE